MANWIEGAIKHPGAVHSALHIPQGQKIPAAKMAVKESDSPLMKKRKQLARTLGALKKR